MYLLVVKFSGTYTVINFFFSFFWDWEQYVIGGLKDLNPLFI